jgi:hypothetical protein
MRELYRLAAAALLALACSTPFPEPSRNPAGGGASLTVEPDAPLDAVAPVLRLRLEHDREPADAAEDVLLVAGELSDYHLRRIQKRDLPQTLVARLVPALVWTEERTIVLAPSVPLELGATYSFASPTLGRIGQLRVRETSEPWLERIWPPKAEGQGSERVVFCSEQPISVAETDAWLDPGRVEARVSALGTDSPACLLLSPLARPDAGARLVPPSELSGRPCDPAPLEHLAGHTPPPDAICAADELVFGPGCARVEDDRAVVRSRAELALWIVTGNAFSSIDAVPADRRFVVRGLPPGAATALELSVLDLSGAERRSSLVVTTEPARARIVLSEVMANPLGPEPAQEWVELVNDGLLPVDLAGFTLEDLGGVAVLPAFELAPGAYALVVRDDYVLDDGLDVVAAPGTPLLRVPQLGKNGLGNTGEPLVLRAPDGAVVSRFPAMKPKAGVSVARRTPWALDDEPGSFALHAAPGASPGEPNVVD